MPKTVSIDSLTVAQAHEAVESEGGEIRCPNGCYDPYALTHEHIRAAQHLPQCEACGAYHEIAWGETDPSTETCPRCEAAADVTFTIPSVGTGRIAAQGGTVHLAREGATGEGWRVYVHT